MDIHYMQLEFFNDIQDVFYSYLYIPSIKRRFSSLRKYKIEDPLSNKEKSLEFHVIHQFTDFKHIVNLGIPEKKNLSTFINFPDDVTQVTIRMTNRFIKLDNLLQKFKIKHKHIKRRSKLKKKIVETLLSRPLNRKKRIFNYKHKKKYFVNSFYDEEQLEQDLKLRMQKSKDSKTLKKCLDKEINLYRRAYKFFIDLFFKRKIVKLTENSFMHVFYFTNISGQSIIDADIVLKNIFEKRNNYYLQELRPPYFYKYSKPTPCRIRYSVPNDISLYSSTISEKDSYSLVQECDYSLVFNMNRLKGHEEIYLFLRDNYCLQEEYFEDSLIFIINDTVCFYEEYISKLADCFKKKVNIKDIVISKKVIWKYINTHR